MSVDLISMGNSRSSSHVVRLGLMICSIVLLMLLQIFWLMNLYEQSSTGFQRETSALLGSTIFAVRDSIFQHEISQNLDGGDSLQLRRTSLREKDRRITIVEGARTRQIESIRVDSIYVPGVMARPEHRDSTLRKFVLRIRGDDTLSIDLLKSRYRATIDRAGYRYNFFIRHVKHTPTDTLIGRIGLAGIPFPNERFKQNPFSDTLETERFHLGPQHSYAAVFPSMRIQLMKKIMPQILFSGALTIITIAAFVTLYRNLRSQERLMELKNDFISNVTHELKTPIATVSVALEALKDFHALKNPERTKEYLDIAQHELNRLSLMTDKILKASAFEQQGITFVPGLVNMNDVIGQVLTSLTIVLDKKRITISFHKNGAQFIIPGSEMHLTNVIYNLLDNAIKYSASGTNIRVTLEEMRAEVIFTVQDQGVGIDPVHQSRVFEKFFRVPTGDIHNTRGYGLGLNYVSEVVRSHKGSIILESALGKGSCFTVRLPKPHGN